MTTIELRGLELHGRHGVLAHEREHGQRFLFDLELDVPAPERDAIDATVDYRDVAAAVREVSDGRDYVLLETLAAARRRDAARAVPGLTRPRPRAEAGRGARPAGRGVGRQRGSALVVSASV